MSAPVVDTNDRLVGRVTVDEILDFVRERGQEDVLAQAGLREEEDVFASVWASFRNRWAWLAINLVTAFIASRVIGAFEGSIEKLVALAALMPIVAGIGGNSGNQTITMIVRAAALGQVSLANARQLIRKEITVSLLNGVIWGGVMGIVATLLYKDVALGLVMVLAMTLNLILAALMGVLIPMTMLKFGRDPAVGSSVLITAVTDSGRILHLPRARDAVPGVTRRCAPAGRPAASRTAACRGYAGLPERRRVRTHRNKSAPAAVDADTCDHIPREHQMNFALRLHAALFAALIVSALRLDGAVGRPCHGRPTACSSIRPA